MAIVALMVSLVMPYIASANDPAWIKLKYNLQEKSLKVIIGHTKIIGSTDHISKVEIKINGAVYKTFNYKYNVHNNSIVAYVYNDIQAKPGDRIEVTATSVASTENGAKSCAITVGEGMTESK
jgi:hypothetical protein